VQELCVGGLTPLTTIDFPGRLAAVVFCQGCPWRCGYCHNPHLLPPAERHGPAWEEVRAFLGRRRGLLDAVVFSGGEPTAQRALAAAVAQVKALGFQVGLHTAGVYPQRLAPVLADLDWIGLDAKGPIERYAAITGVRGAGGRFRRSLELVVGSGVDYEVRTTLYEGATPEELLGLGHWLAEHGVRRYVWQIRRAGDPPTGVGGGAWRTVRDRLARKFERFEIRGAT